MMISLQQDPIIILGLQKLIRVERADHMSFSGTPLSWNMNRKKIAKIFAI